MRKRITLFCFCSLVFFLLRLEFAKGHSDTFTATAEGSTVSSHSGPNGSAASLDVLQAFFVKFNLDRFAVEGYLITCYIESLVMWIKLQFDKSFLPTEAFSLFDFYDIRVPVFGGGPQEAKDAKFPQANSEESKSSSAYRDTVAQGEQWLHFLLQSLKTEKVSDIIATLAPDGLTASSKQFPIPPAEQLQRKEAVAFFEEFMGKIRIWLGMASEDGDHRQNNIRRLASIVVKEIKAEARGVLSDAAKSAAKTPLGPSNSPLASPLLVLGALLSQVIVQTLLVAVGKNELFDIITRLQHWLEEPITRRLQFGQMGIDFRQLLMSYIDRSLKLYPESAKLPSPNGQLTWGLAVGMFTIVLYRLQARNVDPLNGKELGAIVAHLTVLVEKKDRGGGDDFWGFFEGLSNPKVIHRITQWFGCAQAISRLAVHALKNYQGVELSPLNRKIHLAVPFEVLDTILSFSICSLKCPKTLNTFKKASVQISLVEWMIRFVGATIYLDSLAGSRDPLTHDVAAYDRSGMSWALLVDIPVLFCNVYQWAILSDYSNPDAPVDEELLKKIVAGLPVAEILLKNYTTSSTIENLWKKLTTTSNHTVVTDRLLLSGGLISEKSKLASDEKWILSQLVTLLQTIDTDIRWNGGIGGCDLPVSSPPPEEKTTIKERIQYEDDEPPAVPRFSFPSSPMSPSKETSPNWRPHDAPMDEVIPFPTSCSNGPPEKEIDFEDPSQWQ